MEAKDKTGITSTGKKFMKTVKYTLDYERI
jgi:hypothetical protein